METEVDEITLDADFVVDLGMNSIDLLEAVMDGRVLNERDPLLQEAQKLLRAQPADPQTEHSQNS